MNTAGMSGAPLRFLGLAAGGLGLVVTLAAAAAPFSPLGPVTKFGGQLAGAGADSPSDAWAVGSTNSQAALILHWNGTSWTRVAGLSPDTSLIGVSALSTSGAWAVGLHKSGTTAYRTVVLHWNGTRWAQVASPDPGPAPVQDGLSGVSAVSPGDAWAVGQSGLLGKPKTLVLHWNGTAWTQVASPDPSRSTNILTDVSADSPGDAWAVGEFDTGHDDFRTLMLHWDGTAWTQVASPSPGARTNELFHVDALSPSDAWAVGDYFAGRALKTLVLHWNGSRWAQIASPSPGPAPVAATLSGVSAISPSDAWAVGAFAPTSGVNRPFEPMVLHWNGTRWTRVASPRPPGRLGGQLFAVSARSPGDAWAVGEIVNPNISSTTWVLHWNGKGWTRS